MIGMCPSTFPQLVGSPGFSRGVIYQVKFYPLNSYCCVNFTFTRFAAVLPLFCCCRCVLPPLCAAWSTWCCWLGSLSAVCLAFLTSRLESLLGVCSSSQGSLHCVRVHTISQEGSQSINRKTFSESLQFSVLVKVCKVHK